MCSPVILLILILHAEFWHLTLYNVVIFLFLNQNHLVLPLKSLQNFHYIGNLNKRYMDIDDDCIVLIPLVMHGCNIQSFILFCSIYIYVVRKRERERLIWLKRRFLTIVVWISQVFFQASTSSGLLWFAGFHSWHFHILYMYHCASHYNHMFG